MVLKLVPGRHVPNRENIIAKPNKPSQILTTYVLCPKLDFSSDSSPVFGSSFFPDKILKHLESGYNASTTIYDVTIGDNCDPPNIAPGCRGHTLAGTLLSLPP
jgi:hypothetical protein